MKNAAERLGVGACARIPKVEETVGKGVFDELVFGGVEVVDVVAGEINGDEVVVWSRKVLGGDQAEVFAEELATECGGKVGGLPGLAVHGRL